MTCSNDLAKMKQFIIITIELFIQIAGGIWYQPDFEIGRFAPTCSPLIKKLRRALLG